MSQNELTVQEMVDHELARNPGAALEDLHWMGTRIDPAVEKLSLEEFRVRYLPAAAGGLPAEPRASRKSRPAPAGSEPSGARATKATPSRRKTPRSRRGEARAGKPKASPRKARTAGPAEPPAARGRRDGEGTSRADAVRRALFHFAADLEAAGTRAEVTRVVARVDRYIEEALGG